MNHTNQMHIIKCRAFTLIEVLVVLAIVGILFFTAIPAYQNVIKGSNRKVAQADLMAFGVAMEAHAVSQYSYAAAGVGGANTGKPAIFVDYSPITESPNQKRYQLTIDKLSDNGLQYRLRAKPIAKSIQAGDGDLFLFSDGRRAWDKDGNGTLSTNEYCWEC